MAKTIDPWGSKLIGNYEKIMKEFGLEKFKIEMFPNPNRIMRRNVVFAGRDLKIIAASIKNKKPFYALSGIMPTGDKIHLGNKLTVENLRYFQEHGAITYILVADLEALTTRGVRLKEAKKRALNFHIPAYIALGLDPRKTVFYFQSENKDVIYGAYEFASKITLNEFRAVYGDADPSRILAAVTQVADILYPQLKKPMPGVIPVGIDQDPHIRLTRDVTRRLKSKYGFVLPSSLEHKYTPSLDGKLKMSKSNPGSYIELPEDPEKTERKIMNAVTGGRVSIEEQKKKGGQPEKCMVFELLKQHLVEDDDELADIYKRCRSGNLLCGECKKMTACKMKDFLNDFNDKLKKAKKDINKISFVKF
jgi:tryptophanyl-tRNA synthetase